VKPLTLSVLIIAVVTAAFQAQAYEGLQADYKACTHGAGKIANAQIVRACTRLIDNATKKNELIGFFHALRAAANIDKRQNCQDARIAGRLLKKESVIQQVKRLAAANCGTASAPSSSACLAANTDSEKIVGRVRIDKFKTASGQSGSAYILDLPAATCLASNDPDERVKRSRTIHIFASQNKLHASIERFVGKAITVHGRASPAHTVHHRAPIIMDVAMIAEQ